MSDVLARICADKRDHIAARKRETSIDALDRAAASGAPPRGFARALQRALAAGRYGLIAEIKKASPSEGLIRSDFDPAGLARAYRAGGAACLSVLTDRPYFQGEDGYLALARDAVDLPVLRKDFMLDAFQVAESRAIGADCILIIMAAVDDALARDLQQAATGYGMDVLVEVHDRAELDRALTLGTSLIGINNRNLKTLVTDIATTEALVEAVPAGRTVVSESGLHTKTDLDRMAASGVHCFLVGTSLMRQADVTAATMTLLGLDAAAERA